MKDAFGDVLLEWMMDTYMVCSGVEGQKECNDDGDEQERNDVEH